jgi:F-type H+-transporting ATPase subunit epsilon
MILKILVPEKVVVSSDARKVTVEAQNGSFCVLPHHVDFVAVLVPSLLMYVREGGDERYLAIDEGVFVKRGDEVLVSTRRAVEGLDIGSLRDRITKEFEVVEERERAARSAVARLEADLARRFMELTHRD